MSAFSSLHLVTAGIAVTALVVSFLIFNKVYQEKYKRPWMFIGISTIFFTISEILRFYTEFFTYFFAGSNTVTQFILLATNFIALTCLCYGIFLEHLILKYYKGRFVKMNLVPVQEEQVRTDVKVSIRTGASYIATKKDELEVKEQFALATKKGFEGFLVTEELPKEVRATYSLLKTPIVWLHSSSQEDSARGQLDENSELLDPMQLNQLIVYIDSFLEQSQNPYIFIVLDPFFRMNSFAIVFEFIKYISAKVQRNRGVLVCLVDEKSIAGTELTELESELRPYESSSKE
ncbi:DUF835 domain-containing protein [Candidatus Woesearchaeota archaeon]|nr:DUF835 domain-containing protein [Nanoarchaeota archaeon]MCB9370869.1 DUF835 domain-containing protein [Candidatus Woesearchaeota archaeon]USN43971.1 MAG: DUF835 domain-containing protein [Candidatus Woesearchaeota archaeon]